jgi:hypothetical protein
MRYIFAVDDKLRRKHGGHLARMFQFLSSHYGKVSVYHRSGRKSPLFEAGDSVICATRESMQAFASLTPNCLSFWDIYDGQKQGWSDDGDDMEELRAACLA